MNQKVITTILVIAIVALAGTTIYFAAAKSDMQTQVKTLTEQNAQMKGQLDALKPMLAEIEQARVKAQKASIKSYMASAVPSGIICEDGKKAIVSGNGDAKVCVGEDFTWPAIKACGANASDTKWTVRNGAGSNWDFTLDCKGFADCNGPQNAICNATAGCKFSGSCQ
jgi:hypothetical protein